MNAVQMAINKAQMVIPKMILEDCFIKRFQDWRMVPKSLEQRIKEEVILKMVLPDLNLVNGVYTYIPLVNAIKQQSDRDVQIYYIPKEVTGGKSIMTAISIGYGQGYLSAYPNMSDCGNTMVNRATMGLLNSLNDQPVTTNPRVDLIAENTVIVYDGMFYPPNAHLVCILENDENLSILRPRSIPLFIQLIILAIKAYIYNELVLEIDKGRLYGGQELGRFREIVDEYRSAQEMYDELLRTKIGKIFYMNSRESMSKHVRFMLAASRR